MNGETIVGMAIQYATGLWAPHAVDDKKLAAATFKAPPSDHLLKKGRRMRKEDLLEALMGTVMFHDPDLTSSFGYMMWDLVSKDERTLSFRAAPVQVKHVTGWVEETGFAFGWHSDGEWETREMLSKQSIPEFLAMVSELLEAGARPIADPLVRVVDAAATPSP